MPIRSHVDLCLFVRVIHIKNEDIPSQVFEMLEQPADEGRYFNAWREQFISSPRIIFHEAYHYWQGIRLPYLYWYALLSFRTILQAFQELNKIPELHDWDCIIPEVHRINLKERCLRLPNNNYGIIGSDVQKPLDVLEEISISPIDLLESATSITEWQSTTNRDDIINPIFFTRWCKRNPAYTHAYEFASRAIGDAELTLRCFVSLVCASFKTTDPVRAFLSLIASIVVNQQKSYAFRDFVAQKEPCQWPNLFDLLLDDLPYEAKPDSTATLLKTPFCRLNLANWAYVTINGNELIHPFLTEPARKWIDKEMENPGFSWLVPQPFWVSNDVFWEGMKSFEPYTVVCFHLKNGKRRVFSFGHGIEPDEVLFLMTMHSVIKKASGAFFDEDNRFCHHTECPEYKPNYCNSYPIIPEQFSECAFPSRIKLFRTRMADLPRRS